MTPHPRVVRDVVRTAAIRWRTLTSWASPTGHAVGLTCAALGLAALLPLFAQLTLTLVIDDLLNRHGARVVPLAVVALAAGLGGTALQRHGQLRCAELANAATSKVRALAFERMQRTSLDFYVHGSPGAMVTRILKDAADVTSLLRDLLPPLVGDIALVTFIAVVSTVISPLLGLVVFVAAVLGYTTNRRSLRAAVASASDELEATARLGSRLAEQLHYSAALQTRIFKRVPFETSRVEDLARDVAVADVAFVRALGDCQAINSGLAVTSATVALIAGGLAVGAHAMSVGTLVALMLLVQALNAPLGRLLGLTRFNIAYRLAAFDRIVEALQLPASQTLETDEHSRPGALGSRPPNTVSDMSHPTSHSAGPTDTSQQVIRFENVSYRYPAPAEIVPESFRGSAPADPRRGSVVIRDISFTIKAGEFVAIVGASGGGKSTLGLLAAGVFAPTTGSITLGSLRRAKPIVAHVAQEAWLSNSTVRENLNYANPAASDVEMVSACVRARVHSTVRSFALGYNTVVGERGQRLSGGERQRLALARALLSDPDLVVLDEPTAHLDADTARELQSELDTVFVERARLVIAHRLASVVGASEILVLDGGTIVERGTHQDLLRNGGLYSRMFGAEEG